MLIESDLLIQRFRDLIARTYNVDRCDALSDAVAIVQQEVLRTKNQQEDCHE